MPNFNSNHLLSFKPHHPSSRPSTLTRSNNNPLVSTPHTSAFSQYCYNSPTSDTVLSSSVLSPQIKYFTNSPFSGQDYLGKCQPSVPYHSTPSMSDNLSGAHHTLYPNAYDRQSPAHMPKQQECHDCCRRLAAQEAEVASLKEEVAMKSRRKV